MKSDYFQKYVEIIKSGAAQGFLSLKMIRSLPLKVPSDLLIQNKIATILSNYDSLIENNNKRVKLLEEMAEDIYKEWFVRLRVPNYENTKIIDGVPEGWKYEKLSSHIDIRCFKNDPSVKSSLKFLRKSQWARDMVEKLYIAAQKDKNPWLSKK